jgi:hypothetical protein
MKALKLIFPTFLFFVTIACGSNDPVLYRKDFFGKYTGNGITITIDSITNYNILKEYNLFTEFEMGGKLPQTNSIVSIEDPNNILNFSYKIDNRHPVFTKLRPIYNEKGNIFSHSVTKHFTVTMNLRYFSINGPNQYIKGEGEFYSENLVFAYKDWNKNIFVQVPKKGGGWDLIELKKTN